MKENSLYTYLRKLYLYLSIALLSLFPQTSFSQILFEGYYKLEIGSLHIGYIIQRFQLDKKSKKMNSTYYVKTVIEKEQSSESLDAFADEKLKPISYQYTYNRRDSQGKNQVKLIDATVKKGKLIKIVRDGYFKPGQKIPEVKSDSKIKENSIFSTFLTYGILSKGLKVNTSYPYHAIAEETGDASSGLASVVKIIKKKGRSMYKVANDFKGSRFKNIVDSRGVIFKFQSDKVRLTGTLVNKASDATKGFPVNQKAIKKLFGYLPKASGNTLVSKRSQSLNN